MTDAAAQAWDNNRENVQQTIDTFNQKWKWWPEFKKEYALVQLDWLVKKMNMQSREELFSFWKSCKKIANVGSGNGYVEKLIAEVSPETQIVGFDVNTEMSKKNNAHLSNVKIETYSVFDIPHSYDGQFDLVMSEGVLNFTGDTRKAVHDCARLVAPGGKLMVHVYHKGNAVRELTDNALSKQAGELTPEQCLEWCKQFTTLGQVLHEQNKEITIPDVPALGWKAGTYKLQEFMFYHVVRCFWDWTGKSTFEENNLDMYDWFGPRVATRHTTEELVEWTKECEGMTVIATPKANRTGATVVAKRTV